MGEPVLEYTQRYFTHLRCNTNEMSTNDLVNHMKDIHEVKDNQPLSFSHVRYRGVSRKCAFNILDCKGGAITHPHPVPPFSKKF